MKNVILVFCLLMLSANLAHSQPGIELAKHKTQKKILIPDGSKVHLKSHGKTFSGKFHLISDQSFTIQSDTIQLSQIQILFSKNAGSQIGGASLLAASSLVGATGLWITGAGIADGSGYAIMALIVGVPLATLGIIGGVKGVLHLSRGKKYPPHKWEYKIVGFK